MFRCIKRLDNKTPEAPPVETLENDIEESEQDTEKRVWRVEKRFNVIV